MLNLPFFSSVGKKNNIHYFGLFLKEDQGVGLIFAPDGKTMRLIASAHFKYTDGWDNLSEDVDNLLMGLEKTTAVSIRDTIFFFYSHAIESQTQEIKADYFRSVKKIAKDLDLNPLGYIEVVDGVMAYLQSKEESAINAVMIELDKTNCTIFVLRNGKRSAAKTFGRSENLLDDLTLVFNRLKTEMAIPARIILYNSADLEKQAMLIVSHRWSSSIFIQLPRVEVLNGGDLLRGLGLVFGEQIFSQKKTEKTLPVVLPENKLGFVIGADIGDRSAAGGGKGDHFAKFLPKFSWPKLPSIQGWWRYWLGLGMIVLSLFLIEFFLHRAKIVIYFPSRQIKKVVSYESDRDGDALKIASDSMVLEAAASKLTNGKKAVGERAKGEVTIHNFDSADKVFNKEVTLSADNLQFVLDDDVKVASATDTFVDGNLVRSPGKAKVKVTAAEIGPESNLSKGTRFQIADYSINLFFAINADSLTGGSKKEVRTVAKNDLEELRATVLEKVKKEYPGKIKSQLTGEDVIINDLTQSQTQEENFSREVGEEANDVGLNAKVKISYWYFAKKDFIAFLNNRLQDEIGAGYSLSSSSVNFNNVKAQNNEGMINIDWSIEGKAQKDIDAARLKTQLTGQSQSQLTALLKGNYQADGFDLTIVPAVFFLRDHTPWRSDNITIKINSL